MGSPLSGDQCRKTRKQPSQTSLIVGQPKVGPHAQHTLQARPPAVATRSLNAAFLVFWQHALVTKHSAVVVPQKRVVGVCGASLEATFVLGRDRWCGSRFRVTQFTAHPKPALEKSTGIDTKQLAEGGGASRPTYVNNHNNNNNHFILWPSRFYPHVDTPRWRDIPHLGGYL